MTMVDFEMSSKMALYLQRILFRKAPASERESGLCYARGLCRIVLVASVFFIAPFAASAATVLDGVTIAASETWDTAGSPYVIRNEVTIAAGAKLTILPGVVVKFEDDAMLTAEGSIEALGAASEPIIFTSIYDDAAGGDTNGDGGATSPTSFDPWGLNFYGAARLPASTFRYTTIRNSQYGAYVSGAKLSLLQATFEESDNGFYVDGAGMLSVADSTLGGTDGDLVAADGGSYVEVSNSVMREVFDGDVFGMYSGAYLFLDESRIEDIGDGSAIGLYSAHATTTRSIISGGTDSALEPYSGSSLTVLDTTIEDFSGTAVYLYKSRVIVQDSIIRGNDYGVYASGMGSDVSISGSVIADNASYGVYDEGGAPTDARGNFWGDASGPFHSGLNPDGLGNEIYGGVLFEPWLTEDPFAPPEPSCCSSVAFIPGIKGSRLYKKVGDSENQLWEPNRNADVEKLLMDANGVSLDLDIYTRDVIGRAFGAFDVYSGFIGFMDGLVSDGTIAGWRALPYDWRLAPDEVVRKGVETGGGNISYLSPVPAGELPFMIKEIEELAAVSQNGKVTLVTHSNGGLVAKSLLARLEALKTLGVTDLVDKIDRVIMVAAPQLGTPSAIAAMLHGDGEHMLGGFFLNKQTARVFAENLPGAYALLPSARYFDVVSDPVMTFSDDITSAANFGAYAPDISSFAELGQFFLAILDGRSDPAFGDNATPNILNPALLDSAESFHAAADAYLPPPHIKVVEIAGWGLDTPKGIRYDAKRDCPIFCSEYELEREEINTVEGDSVVVYPSVVSSSGTDYFFNIFDYNEDDSVSDLRNRKHSNILGAVSIQNFLRNMVTESNVLPNHITTSKPSLDGEDGRLTLSVFSPITIDAYDSANLHTGLIPSPIPDSDLIFFEEKIPNSYYKEFGEGKTVGLDGSGTYRIVMNGTGYGTFTFEKKEFSEDGSATTTTFTDLPVTPLTIAEVEVLPDATTTVIKLDSDGDGDTDFTLEPSDAFNPILFLNSLKLFVYSLDLPPKIERYFIKWIDKVIKGIEKGKIKNVEKKLKQAIKKLSHHKGHFKKIPEEDLNAIISMLNELLTNLK